MLTSLHIDNFAVVKHLDIDLHRGLTVLTGETGAGKSIMIDALTLLLGGRAEISLIRPDSKHCDISAQFNIENNSEPFNWINTQNLHSTETNTILLRRLLSREGRSKCYINDQLVTAQKLKELGDLLVHIHGQHAHHALWQATTHRKQLDHYANHADLLHAVYTAYKHYQQLELNRQTLQTQEKIAYNQELLNYQINELSELNTQVGELKELNILHQTLHHANDYLQITQTLQEQLQSDTTPNLSQQLHNCLQLLQQLPQAHTTVRNVT